MNIGEWLKNSARLKRWLFLILLGILIICYSMAELMKVEVIDFKDILFIILEFMAGILIIIYGIISIQKRTLEIFIEANGVSTSNLKKQNISMDSLIFDKNIYENGPKVVVIGGGSGANSLVKGLKNYTANITVVITPENNLRNIGALQRNGMPIYRDIHLNIASLSNDEELMKKTLEHNFTSKSLEGYNFGDLYLLGMQEIFGNISNAIKKSTEVLNIKGEIVPATTEDITICAELTDGTIIKGKENIPQEVMKKVEAISRVFLDKTNVRPTPRVLEAIEEADIIVVAPGSLYTEIIPNLLVKNVVNAIKNSKAKKVYVANIMTDEGQTDGYTLSEHLLAINEHVGENIFDFCIADTGEIIPEYIRAYHKKGTDVLTVDDEEIKKIGIKLLKQDLSKIVNGKIRHDSNLIALTLMQIVLAEIKYSEDNSKLQITTLETVLKAHKKQQKQREKQLKRAKKKYNGKETDSKKIEEEIKKSILESEKSKRKKGKSKFKEKYTERIKIITEVDKKSLNDEKSNFKNFFENKKKIEEKINQKKIEEIDEQFLNFDDEDVEEYNNGIFGNHIARESKIKSNLQDSFKNNLKDNLKASLNDNMSYKREVEKEELSKNDLSKNELKFSTQKIRTIMQEGYLHSEDDELKKKSAPKAKAKSMSQIDRIRERERREKERQLELKRKKQQAKLKLELDLESEVKEEKTKRKTRKQKEKETAQELLQELKKLETVREKSRKTKEK